MDDYTVAIDTEYARWQLITSISSALEERARTPKKKYEILNIFERYLLNSANVPRVDGDAIFVKVPISHYIYGNMIREIVDKKIAYEGQAKKLIQSVVKNRVDAFLRVDHRGTVGSSSMIVYTRGTGGECRYGYKKFNMTLSSERVDVLHVLAEHHGIEHQGDRDYCIVSMLLRYSCLLQRGQQWNLPRAWYTAMYVRYGPFIEMFASPLNSQSILLRSECSDSSEHSECSERSIRYGSLFRDTDMVFGSIGNAFELTANDVEGQVVIANPPYVLEIMDRTSRMIQEWLEVVDVTVILNVPDWTDAEYYEQSINSSHVIFEHRLEAREHYYENNMEVPVKRIVAMFPSHLFVFGTDADLANAKSTILEGYAL